MPRRSRPDSGEEVRTSVTLRPQVARRPKSAADTNWRASFKPRKNTARTRKKRERAENLKIRIKKKYVLAKPEKMLRSRVWTVGYS